MTPTAGSLTPAERFRFVAWLEESAADNEAIIPRLEKMQISLLVDIKKQDVEAFRRVAEILRSTESYGF